MDGEPTEPVPFQELRYLWHVVNEVFGKENAVPVRQEGGVEDDLSDGPDMERPPEAPEGGEGAGGEEEEKPEAKATIPKQDTVRLLHTLTGELLDALDGHDPDVLASLSQLTDPLLVGDAATHPLLAKIGFIPPEENPTENPWLFCGVKRGLLEAANHFFDTKLGGGHQNECPTYAAIAMAMISGGDMQEAPLSPNPEIDLDIDALIHQVRYGPAAQKALTADEVKTLCYRARAILENEDNIVTVEPQCTVVGDIHGQFQDLVQQVLERGGDPGETRYVFLGDFVDRGEDSLLCLSLILLYKIKFPEHVYILRGNHESRVTNTMYGFHEECRQKYPTALSSHSMMYAGKPDSHIWNLFNHLFDALPLAALIGGKAFGCHGGLSPELQSLDKLLTFNRFQDIMPQGPMADLTWSDPGPQEGWRVNVRGSGHAFGHDVTARFCEANGLDFVCRAHQCVKQGYKWDQDDKIVTIFSAPNYCYAQNKGAIMKLDEEMRPSFISYEQAQVIRGDIHDIPAYFKSNEGQDDDDDDDDDGPTAGMNFGGQPDFSHDPSAPTDANKLESESSTDSQTENDSELNKSEEPEVSEEKQPTSSTEE